MNKFYLYIYVYMCNSNDQRIGAINLRMESIGEGDRKGLGGARGRKRGK